MSTFTAKTNIDLLWDVLLEEPIIKNTTRTKKEMMYSALNNNIQKFYEKEKNNYSDLISLNKTFLSQMLKVLRSDSAVTKNTNIAKPANNELYKVEDIQARRQQEFQQNLADRQHEFDNAITFNRPPVPNFAEKIEDEKIKGMDELIAKTVAQRNFEISQIHNQDVSTKNSQDPIKYIKIDQSRTIPITEDIIELTNQKKPDPKKLSWSNEVEVNYIEPYYKEVNNENILNKFKKIPFEEKLSNYSQEYNSLLTKMNSMDLKIDLLTEHVNKILNLCKENNLKIN